MICVLYWLTLYKKEITRWAEGEAWGGNYKRQKRIKKKPIQRIV
jgi:hypothetical protein